MDIQSFIQSGLLEAYLLGQCSAEERALVERMAAGHAKVRAELASIERALEGYAAANSVDPPAWMKGRILERIEQETVPPAPSAVSKPVVLRLFQLLALGFALLGGFFFFQKNNLSSENKVLETRVAELQKQVDDCNQKGQEAEKLKAIVQFLRHDDTREVPLQHATGKANAYYNATSRTAALDINTLPAALAGKYYQFWAIVKDQPPISMGMVDLQAENGWQSLRYVDNAVTLAISREDTPNESLTPHDVAMGGNIPPGE